MKYCLDSVDLCLLCLCGIILMVLIEMRRTHSWLAAAVLPGEGIMGWLRKPAEY